MSAERILQAQHWLPSASDYVMAHGDGHFDGFIFDCPSFRGAWPAGPLSPHRAARARALHRLWLWTRNEATRWRRRLGLGAAPVVAVQVRTSPTALSTRCPLPSASAKVSTPRNASSADDHPPASQLRSSPFSRSHRCIDDVHEGDELAVAAHAIGPSRTLIQMRHVRHDVFVSAEGTVVEQALASLRTWLVSQASIAERWQRREALRIKVDGCRHRHTQWQFLREHCSTILFQVCAVLLSKKYHM